MKYSYFKPPPEEPVQLPSQQDLLYQIEADHYAAKQREDRGEVAVLEARYATVKDAASDEAAYEAYVHDVTYVPPEPEVAPEEAT